MFQVITDTSANLPSKLARENDITVIPFPYFVNGSRHTCLETEEFDGKSFYGAMREGAEISTSQINPQHYLDVMKPILQKGLDILFIGMSSGISGSYHSAEIAAEELRNDFPERKIRLVDTLGASLGEGLLVLKAKRDKLLGLSLDDVYEKLLDLDKNSFKVILKDLFEYFICNLSNFG